MNTSRPLPIVAAPGAVECAPRASRREQRRLELLSTVDLLHRRRADLVSDELIEDCVAFDWLEWNGGTLRLTVVGENVCQEMRARLNVA